MRALAAVAGILALSTTAEAAPKRLSTPVFLQEGPLAAWARCAALATAETAPTKCATAEGMTVCALDPRVDEAVIVVWSRGPTGAPAAGEVFLETAHEHFLRGTIAPASNVSADIIRKTPTGTDTGACEIVYRDGVLLVEWTDRPRKK